ncbi:hypothetical protein BX600DRAFT_136449 [Xylariales sp. PMI_506]|nr:hypothetical protein BX600DRAFT_136449 [Xylariales sp. PMI_506]
MASSHSVKRPRLSLQIKTSSISNIRSKSTLANVDPKSPTAFNTLSNVYITAIDRSTPVQSTPLTAINLLQNLKFSGSSDTSKDARTHTPYTANYPETPLSANPRSPTLMEFPLPSMTMTATPPLSAGPIESSASKVFSFAPSDIASQSLPSSAVQSRRRAVCGPGSKAPYTHPRALHSILRNSPLPPSPRRQSLRLQEKAARRVGYESPLTQTITTEKYTKSHIDLLVEEASPYSASPITEDSEMILDLATAYTGDETRDGGQTPGPFEEMRRRVAGLGTEVSISSPRPGGIRKRKKQKRKWVWTIGQDGEEEERAAVAAARATAEASTPRLTVPKAATPEPLTAVKVSVEPAEPEEDAHVDMEVDISDTSSALSSCSRATTPFSIDFDLKTPTAAIANSAAARVARLGSVDLINPETGSRRDTPIPPDLVMT